eukprot:m.39403 g.39403  ORF g.39403 m.39403 type:complete len:90 (+) comp45555_c0_seq2:84-353(+)
MCWLLVAVAVVLLTHPCLAAPILFGGHYYELVSTTATFATAQTAATARSFNSWSGHLITVTTQGRPFSLSILQNYFILERDGVVSAQRS